MAQDAFAKLLGSKTELRDPAAYLRTTVVNACRSRWRRAATVRRFDQDRRREPVAVPEEVTEALAARLTLRNALRRLSRRQREAVVLRYYAGLTDPEVAVAMGVSLGSAKTHLQRGLAALAEELEELR